MNCDEETNIEADSRRVTRLLLQRYEVQGWCSRVCIHRRSLRYSEPFVVINCYIARVCALIDVCAEIRHRLGMHVNRDWARVLTMSRDVLRNESLIAKRHWTHGIACTFEA